MKRILCIVLTLALLVSAIGCSAVQFNKPEQCAVKFIESMYEGDAEAWVGLLFDDVLNGDMIANGYATEELYVYAIEKAFDELIDAQKSVHGKKWEYEISVIDSYVVESPEEFKDYEIMEIYVKVEHTGKKLLFFKTNELEEMKIQVINKDGHWFVIDWSDVVV